MLGFFFRTCMVAAGLGLAAEIIPGIEIPEASTMLAASFCLGIVNATIRPVIVFLTFPITFVTLGAFLLVVNAAMLGLVAWLFAGFSIDGLPAALLGAVIVSVTSWFASQFVGASGRREHLVTVGQKRG